ncbi:vacuolar membrane protein [Moniliophthora roreri]|uniref:Vacuolar membrane protein n=1 Tax=Moniliophthora roreri TaxID=221103 RepID=A0A0W0FPX4_MONRR|nr:vacuolar membrane protein [Moniliophthora roreri]
MNDTNIDSSTGLEDADPQYPGVDNRSCQLLGPTALVVQGLMGILVIISLIYKRHREPHKRPWKIWLFDVSKQIVGQMFVHGVNVLISDLVSHYDSSNACVSYFLNILIDTTLGVMILYLIHHGLTHLFSHKFQLQGFESGVYGKPPSWNFWVRQAVVYVVALTTMKFIVIALLALFPGLYKIGEWLLSWTWTEKGDALQVIFTMGIFPIIMNVVQFWIIDSIVKASDAPVYLDADSPHDHADREPLFGVPSDDEDDDAPRRPHDIENPPPTSHSRNSSDNSRPHPVHKSSPPEDIPEESKASGYNTPGDSLELHSYPPSLSNSVTSVSSTSTAGSTPSIREATKLNKKRRGPPSPLNIQPQFQPAINSPQTTGIASPQTTPIIPSKPAPVPVKAAVAPRPADDWAGSWEDSDDWANRVGEEEWTGRRIGETKDSLHDVWDKTAGHAVS